MSVAADLNRFFFGIYPYICLAVVLFGSLVRFDREPYTWKSDSSELLRKQELRWGSNLFSLWRADRDLPGISPAF
jgi:nitrate reductase gamma subunit